ncbi:hypothetical protein [Flavobacterium sp. HTF]|uniref:hypothetical protein n=1 Tax=Flavobacterium sp. HTF TaxID=2170732 RepID=UPI000D5F1A3E|nr:hypothetical protein [Flavobacterium sp. HTF]PWB20664.1 hypothetical protein DCO46_20445 [Flavobacterium sp. HTF]
MRAVFEKPLIFDGKDKKIVLIYSNYIVSDITKEGVDLCIEKINKNEFNTAVFESAINVEDIFEYEFELNVDSYVMFGVKNSDGTSYENVEFKDAETAKLAERTFKEQFEKLGFKRKEEQLSSIAAAVSPLIITTLVAIIGGFLTWFAYELEDYENTRTRVVKWYVYLMVKISKAVGYLPFLIITGLIVLICLFWVVKRMANPPFKIIAIKES